jgi:hypothetical protein
MSQSATRLNMHDQLDAEMVNANIRAVDSESKPTKSSKCNADLG